MLDPEQDKVKEALTHLLTHLIEKAHAVGLVFTVELQPQQPLKMGNHIEQITFREKRK